ncbi:hypothetical protein TcarDRAFT_1860 [Thermosinus carboxydivorans Nor1]|uniref:Uncharacterized protein n=1 Tax=Thermosinus carboxydivorans Nor1 TaxID=401526 RepID=A1HPL0_9FIRM|nr:hypothetical protein TcarDRAFT_1860 [Thermosinus carboxydivorans Nor1]
MRLGKPQDHEAEEFVRENVRGIELYIHNSFASMEGSWDLEIDLEGFLFAKKLVLKGLPPQRSCCS